MAKKSRPVSRPINEGKELLLSVMRDDLEIQTFHAGGPGGQHQNKSDTGVRIIHRASGARGESREDRSQTVNKKNALRRMTEDPRFQTWLNREIFYHDKSPEQRIKEDMSLDNLRFETVDESGAWRVTSGLLMKEE